MNLPCLLRPRSIPHLATTLYSASLSISLILSLSLTLSLDHLRAPADLAPAPPPPPLIADFSATPTIGTSPLTVHFCDHSSSTEPGGVTTWSWDFDGDAIVDSTLQHPVFLYTQNGAYTVSLTVGDGVNPPQQRTRPTYIRVEPAATGPIAAFVFDRSSTMANLRSGSTATRAVDAVDFAEADADFLFATSGTRALLYECHDGVVTRVGGSYATAAAAKAAMQTLPAPSGDKPLADAIRTAVADLVALHPGGALTDRTLLIYSDDGTNFAAPGPCGIGGPASLGGDSCAQTLFQGPLGPFDPGSWQQAVCNVIAANVGLDVYYFANFADGVGNDVLFRALCDLSGGDFTGVPDASTMPRANPWRRGGAGCADHLGVPLRMRRDGVPQLGETVAIGCRTGAGMPFLLGVGFSAEVVGPHLLPYDLGALGAPGCAVRTSWEVTDGLHLAGTMRSLALPNSPALAGLTLFWQGAELHPANNPLGMATSDLLRMLLVP